MDQLKFGHKLKSQRITDVIPIHPKGDMNSCTKFHGSLPISCWDISLWTEVMDRIINMIVCGRLFPTLLSCYINWNLSDYLVLWSPHADFGNQKSDFIPLTIQLAVFASDVIKECVSRLLIWVLFHHSRLTQRSFCWKVKSVLHANTQGDYRKIAGRKTYLSAKAASNSAYITSLASCGSFWNFVQD